MHASEKGDGVEIKGRWDVEMWANRRRADLNLACWETVGSWRAAKFNE